VLANKVEEFSAALRAQVNQFMAEHQVYEFVFRSVTR
jgi:hypothetical protein